jgi:hypothetical protein
MLIAGTADCGGAGSPELGPVSIVVLLKNAGFMLGGAMARASESHAAHTARLLGNYTTTLAATDFVL